MIKSLNKKYFITLLVIFFSFSLTYAQTVTFNVTTVSYGGNYAPRSVFAMWITDASGKFVKTINRQGSARVGYLTNWKSSSNQNVVDATTGATLNSPNLATTSTGGSVSRRPFIWNCKNASGALVPDGTYYINVEFTENNATGKTAKYTFVKGATDQNITFNNVNSNFINATLIYTAPVTAISKTESAQKYDILFSNSTKQLQVSFDAQYHQAVTMDIFNQAGKLICKKNQLDDHFSIGLSKVSTGIYFVKLTDKSGKSQTNKFIVK